jgi:hypothetical protein
MFLSNFFAFWEKFVLKNDNDEWGQWYKVKTILV